MIGLNNTDTICAVSTPPGVGGIAIIRVSGPQAFEAVQRLWRGRDIAAARHASALVGEILDGDTVLDQAVVTVFRAPHSYTTQDTVEISVHGSIYVQSRLLRLLVDGGLCRMAGPGEYTRLAFLAGRLDLAQVEAVADILSARTAGAHNIAINQLKGALTGRIRELREQLIELASLLELELDFSEEDVEFASRDTLLQLTGQIISRIDRLTDSFATGQAILTGYPVALAGATNAGKSTLLNLLLDDDRAIVSDIHGTTRDTIQDTFQIGETLFRITDTAGLRETTDPIEREGINRTCKVIHEAHLIIWLIGHNTKKNQLSEIWEHLHQNLESRHTLLPVITKTDLSDDVSADCMRIAGELHRLPGIETLTVEPLLSHTISDPDTLAALRDTLSRIARPHTNCQPGEVIITNERQRQALLVARTSLVDTRDALVGEIPPDLVAHHLRQAISSLSSITGEITTPDLLTTIFTRFCIGK